MDRLHARTGDVAICLLLLTAPYWLPFVGGYVELGSRVVILALAAMALNFLLGYTGVLSFGHAAYFGLGAYGVAMTMKYWIESTPLAIAVGVITGTVAAAIIGPLIARLRGVYFAMCTIAFGQVFYFIAFQWRDVTGGDDGLQGMVVWPVFGLFRFDMFGRTAYLYCLAVLFVAMAANAA